MPRGISNAEARRIVRALLRIQTDLELYADQLEDGFHAALRRAQARSYERIGALIQDAPDFKALTMDERLRWWIQHKAALEDAVDRAGFQQATNAYLDGLPKFQEFVKASSIAAGRRFLDFPQKTIDYLRQAPFQQFVGIAGRSESRLQAILYDEILGGPAKSTALENFRGAITGSYPWGNKRGFYEWHATTYARTAHIKFAQDLANNEAERAGIVENFLYVGPLDSETRPFCISKVGNIYSRKQIDAMRNGQNAEVSDVWSNRGGYNCRHRWVAVSPGLAEKLKTQEGKQIVQQEQGASPDVPKGSTKFNGADPPAWKKAKTVKAAEKWARDADLADTINYQDLSVSSANEINRVVGTVLREFPDARRKMKFLGSESAYMAQYGESSSGAIAAHYPDRGLYFSLEWFGKSPTRSLEVEVPHSVKVGFLAPDRSPTENIIYHELGHLLDWTKGMRYDPVFQEVVAKFAAQGVSIEKGISEYAAYKWVELFSEAFKEYLLSPSPRPMAQAVGKLMLEKYGVVK